MSKTHEVIEGLLLRNLPAPNQGQLDAVARCANTYIEKYGPVEDEPGLTGKVLLSRVQRILFRQTFKAFGGKA